MAVAVAVAAAVPTNQTCVLMVHARLLAAVEAETMAVLPQNRIYAPAVSARRFVTAAAAAAVKILACRAI